MDRIARQEEMKALRDAGATLESIAGVFHITKQRVSQILSTSYSIQDKDEGAPLIEKYPQLKKMTGRDYARELVRIRDNHTCQLCGYKWKKGRKLDIHHLDCRKEKTRQYDKPGEFGNMITLCHKCHLNIPAHKKSIKEGINNGIRKARK